MESSLIIVIFIFIIHYIFEWLGLPSKVDKLEKQLKRIADVLEKQD